MEGFLQTSKTWRNTCNSREGILLSQHLEVRSVSEGSAPEQPTSTAVSHTGKLPCSAVLDAVVFNVNTVQGVEVGVLADLPADWSALPGVPWSFCLVLLHALRALVLSSGVSLSKCLALRIGDGNRDPWRTRYANLGYQEGHRITLTPNALWNIPRLY